MGALRERRRTPWMERHGTRKDLSLKTNNLTASDNGGRKNRIPETMRETIRGAAILLKKDGMSFLWGTLVRRGKKRTASRQPLSCRA